MKRFASMILCFLILMPLVFAACMDEPDVSSEETTEASSLGTTVTTVGTTAATTKKPVSDTPDEIRDIASKLVSNWNFQGSTEEEMLTDKSTLGKSIEKITLSGKDEEVFVSNGRLTVIDGIGNYAEIACAQDSDIFDAKNKTFVFKARINNNDSAGQNLISGIFAKRSAFEVYFSNARTRRYNGIRYRFNGETKSINGNTDMVTPVNEWRVYAVVVSYNEEGSKCNISLFKSKGEAPKSYKDFDIIVNETILNASSEFMTGTDSLYLGKRSDHLASLRTLDSEFEAIQVYDMALNVAEIASISFEISADTLLSELDMLIKTAESMEKGNNSDAEWSAFLLEVNSAKALTAQNTVEELRNAINKLNFQIAIVNPKDVSNVIGNLTMIPYNNADIEVPINSGGSSYPAFYDIDGDGDMDYVVCGSSLSYGGFYGGGLYFAPKSDGDIDSGLYGSLQRLSDNPGDICFSTKSDGSPIFISTNGTMYTELTKAGFINGTSFSKLTRHYKLYDIDGDGLSDAVQSYGETVGENSYSSDGTSLMTKTSGIRWIKNTGTEEAPNFSGTFNNVRNEKGTAFIVSDIYQYTSIRSFSLIDCDEDGDLDLIGGGWMNTYYYYENIGNAKSPIFKSEGVLIETTSGPLHLDSCRYQMIDYDLDGDGKKDLFVGSDGGTTMYLRFTGRFNETTGAPIFEEGKYLSQKAEYLAITCLSRPTALDWENDGDFDFIVGDAAGFIWLYENLTGGADPSWAAPVKLMDESGKALVIKAGYNGSLQGAQEAEWGYTVPVAADWDGDGDFDVIVNSVTGRIVWLENIGTKEEGQLTQPKAIEVEWKNGKLYPTWQWWVPEGNELVTQHRSTMYAIDFNSDGLCDLVGLDYQGYLVFYERYEEGGVLKLKQGERIFVTSNGKPLQLATDTAGQSGRVKLVVADWNCDGMLDIIVDSTNFELYQTVKTENEKYYLSSKGNLALGSIYGHRHGFTVVDWDNDGDLDIVSGTESGYFYYFENDTK